MSTELIVTVTPRESRAALAENGVLQELFIERANRRGLISNIYKGRVSRVLPGMQAAFIDVGLDRTGFLHASDIAAPPGLDGALEAPVPSSVRELLREGDEILVQVLKDPLGTKGARLTTYVTLPSRFLVYMPQGRGVGVSARIEDEAERLRLREAVQAFAGPDAAGGYIVRTAAEDCAVGALRADMLFLQRLWDVVRTRGAAAPAGQLVHEDLPLELRVLRDQLGEHVDRVLVDAPAAHARMLEFARTFMPESAGRLELYGGSRPIFDLYGIEDEIGRALSRKVPLASGGYLIIDQAEALAAIDVNTGRFVGKGSKDLEETALKTNLEAVDEIAYQLRFRNIGGLEIGRAHV